MAGVKKAQHVNTDELWSKDGTAPDFFAGVMSKRHFHLLVQAIRCDNMDTRAHFEKAGLLDERSGRYPAKEHLSDSHCVCDVYSRVEDKFVVNNELRWGPDAISCSILWIPFVPEFQMVESFWLAYINKQ
ncbi:hypothetical protein JTB14_004888 [Gonioctena quinquepunctata]|nr:hypothetical protein JTB14_004888 [Gonioctena quinquepunctata]